MLGLFSIFFASFSIPSFIFASKYLTNGATKKSAGPLKSNLPSNITFSISKEMELLYGIGFSVILAVLLPSQLISGARLSLNLFKQPGHLPFISLSLPSNSTNR